MCDLEVAVPDGLVEGQIFAVETPFGIFDVVCPEGCGGGCVINVSVPLADAVPEEPADTGHAYYPGQRVQARARGPTSLFPRLHSPPA